MNIDSFLHSGSCVSIGNNRLLIGWGPRTWVKHPPHNDGCLSPSFYFPDFFLQNPTPWFYHEHWQETTPKELLQQLGTASKQNPIQWQKPYRELFFQTFADLQKRFASQELFKAVPFAFDSSATKMDPSRLHYHLIHLLHYISSSSVLHPYGFWGEEEGMLGATPEILFSLNEEKHLLETIALAGTYSRQLDKNQLMKNPKELSEHQLVVDGIKESLASFGEVSIGQLRVLELPTLYHLMTPIHATITKKNSIEDIVLALHPTPALGAFPRQAGLKWLKDLQNRIDRHRFGAPVGVAHQNGRQAHCWVAIRNIQWNRQGLLLGAGCGVIPASQPEKEWNEIELKMHAIKQMLSI